MPSSSSAVTWLTMPQLLLKKKVVEANGDEKDGGGDGAEKNKMDVCTDDINDGECGIGRDFLLVVLARGCGQRSSLEGEAYMEKACVGGVVA